MKTNRILEEVWRAKDELARDAGYDAHRFFEELRRWSEANPHHGRVIRGAEELRGLAAEDEQRRQNRAGALALNDRPSNEQES